MLEKERSSERLAHIPLASGSFEYLIEKTENDLEGTRIGAMVFVSPNGERVPLKPLLEDDIPVILVKDPLIIGGALRLGTPERLRQVEMRSLSTHLDVAIFLHELFHAHQMQRPVLAKLTEQIHAFSKSCVLGASPRQLLRQTEEIVRRVSVLRGPFISARERAEAIYEGDLRRDDTVLEMVDGRLTALENDFQAAVKRIRQTREALGDAFRRGLRLRIKRTCSAALEDDLGENGLTRTIRLRPGNWLVRSSITGDSIEARNGTAISTWKPDEKQRKNIAELTAQLRWAENRLDTVREEMETIERAFDPELARRKTLIGRDDKPVHRQPEDGADDPAKPWTLTQIVQVGLQILERDATNRALAFMRWLEKEYGIVFDRDGSTRRRMLEEALSSYTATTRELYACHGRIPQAVDE